ncbi:MAG: hypothetical protein JWP42_1679 [Pseudomonas sp.]|nr:hypothetical protein [Pseudomonas sp.]
MCRPLRGQARSHSGLLLFTGFAVGRDQNGGSELARESGGSGDNDGEYAGPFAGKPAPTMDCCCSQGLRSAAIKTVGASLLAKTVGQATSMVNVPAPSRASPLPQWIAAVHRICGRPRSTLWERACSRRGRYIHPQSTRAIISSSRISQSAKALARSLAPRGGMMMK